MLYLFRLIRNNIFLITFIFLFGTSVLQVLRFNLYQQSFYFNTSRSILNSAAMAQNTFMEYFRLKDVNLALAAENAALKNMVLALHVHADSSKKVVNDSIGKKHYSYIECGVIKSSTNLRNNFITINKGSASGIEKGMAVISPSGIAGFVFDVSENFALVISVLNSHFAATPMIPEINVHEGSVSWDGTDARIAQLNNINKFEKLKPGMKVLTSNYSVKFPPGIAIGTIKSVKRPNTSSFCDVDLQLATDFSKLSYLYVITDHFKSQLDTLASREIRKP